MSDARCRGRNRLGLCCAFSLLYIMVLPFDHFLDHAMFDAYFVNYLPSQLRLLDVVLITGASFVLSFLATIYPARRAAKIQPAQTLRYE